MACKPQVRKSAKAPTSWPRKSWAAQDGRASRTAASMCWRIDAARGCTSWPRCAVAAARLRYRHWLRWRRPALSALVAPHSIIVAPRWWSTARMPGAREGRSTGKGTATGCARGGEVAVGVLRGGVGALLVVSPGVGLVVLARADSCNALRSAAATCLGRGAARSGWVEAGVAAAPGGCGG